MTEKKITRYVPLTSKTIRVAFWLCLGTIFLINGLSQIDFPLSNPDFSRDTLISRHIAQYGEHTIVGPFNPLLGQIKNSPLYYYLLALPISISDNFYFLQIVNLILQFIPVICIYLIGKILFNNKTGMLAAVLFSINPIIIPTSSHLWQPYLMNVFFSVGLLAGTFYLNKGSYHGIITSSLLLTLAGIIQNSAWSILPIFWVSAYFSLSKSLTKILWVIVPSLSLLILSFTPNMINAYHQNFLGIPPTLVVNPNNFIVSVFNNWMFFLKSFFQMPTIPLVVSTSLALIFLFTIKYLKDTKLKFITFSLISFFIMSSIWNIPWRSDYFIPITGLVVILISKALMQLKNNTVKLAVTILILSYFLTKVDLIPFHNFSGLSALDSATSSLTSEITRIQKNENFTKPDFFRIVYYGGKIGDEVVLSYDAVFWNELENKNRQKFTYLTNSGYGYRSFNDNKYLILACFDITDRECLISFYKDRAIQKNTFITGEGVFNQPIKFYSQDKFILFSIKKSNSEI